MARENKSLYALLGILSLGPQSGYEIKKMIEGSLIHFWQEGYGQIYPNLKKLVSHELATVHTEQQKDKPDKKIYQVTEKGKQELQHWLEKPIDHLPPEKNELLLKLFFGHSISTEQSITHIERHRQQMNENLKIYEGIESFLLQDACHDPNTQYYLLTLNYGKGITGSIINWCDDSIKKLREINKTGEDEQ